jgi:hypothetical protein
MEQPLVGSDDIGEPIDIFNEVNVRSKRGQFDVEQCAFDEADESPTVTSVESTRSLNVRDAEELVRIIHQYSPGHTDGDALIGPISLSINVSKTNSPLTVFTSPFASLRLNG